MKKQITIGIAALLLGLVLSVPLRANALEDEKSIIEGEITEPRRSNPVITGLFWSISWVIFCFMFGVLLYAVALFLGIVGIVLLLTIVGAPWGVILIFISLSIMIVTPVVCLIQSVMHGIPLFIIGFRRGKADIHFGIERAIIRRIAAIIPG